MIIKPEYDFNINKLYYKNFRTYSEYNYLQPGLTSYIKTIHFEKALQLTKPYFDKVNVIDFGCADGFFLPSLSTYFNKVLGIDIAHDFIKISQDLVKNMNLKNVELICNKEMNIKELKSKLQDNYEIMFLLEVIEHVGEKNNIYKSQIQFLNEVSELIQKDGLIIISVPKMVGLSFLIQRIGLWFFNMQREEISYKQLFNASFLYNTDELEEKYMGGHLGFNHKKFERNLEIDFEIIQIKNCLFNKLYTIKK